MQHVDVSGCRLEVHKVAAADGAPGRAPIVFLHEGQGSVAMWRDWPAVVCRATGRPGYLVSRRGYGHSDRVPDVRNTGRLPPDYLQREAWEVLPGLLSALKLTAPVLLGHSDGGSIALLYASRFTTGASIAMAPHVMVEEVSVRAITAAREAYLQGDLRARLSRYHADVDGAFWQWNDVWLSAEFRSFDIRADCTRITAPVLALQGRDDPYGTLAQIEQIDVPAGRIERVELADCGHSPHRDAPQETLRHIVDFLAPLP
jgi:pimeloyl-ACP methyl ester carboxylesterase